MMSKPSSPLMKKVKVKSPKNFFGKKNKNKQHSSPTSLNEENKSSSSSEHGSTASELETPVLSNTAKQLKGTGKDFPTVPNLLSDDKIDADHDDESVAAMSDIRERQNSLSDNHSLNDSLVSDDDYYKQDYFNSRVDEEEISMEVDETAAAVEEESGEEADGSKIADDKEETDKTTTQFDDIDGDGDIVDDDDGKTSTTPRRDNKSTTTAAETTPPPKSLSPSRQGLPSPTITPGSNAFFSEDEMTFDFNLKTPPSLKIDVCTTPNSSTDGPTDISIPITPLEELNTPGGTTNAPQVLQQNKKLRAGRKELLKLLGSTAKQFKSYEEVTSRKISELEERIREMEKDAGFANENRVDEDTGATGPETVIEGQEVVDSKDKLISSLKLQCETLEHCLSEKENELEQKRKAWETDVDMLSDALEKNNEALEHSVSQLERLRKWKTEHDQKEEELQAVNEPLLPIEEEKPREDPEVVEVQKDLGLDSESAQAMKEMELAISEKEQQIKTLEKSLKEKDSDIAQLHTDLDSCLNDIETLKELVNKTAVAKGYEDFQRIVENLQGQVAKSESNATTFKERISELESDLEGKNTEIAQLNEERQRLLTAQNKSAVDVPASTADHLHGSDNDVENKNNDLCEPIDNIKSSLSSMSPLKNDEVGISSPESLSPGASPTGTSRRWTGMSFARRLAKEGRQYAVAVGNANDPESMLGMIRERDRKINALEATIESNTLMIEKLKKDVERMDTEHEEALLQSKKTIAQLEEESAVYLQQVKGFEKAFMTLNESQQTTILPSLDDEEDDETKTPAESVASDRDDEVGSEEDTDNLKSQNGKLERMLSELREESSFQEDLIEKLKTELTTLRVVSQQEKETACDKLRDENKIIEAQKAALENQLVEINKSAAMLRDSLAHDSTSSPSRSKSVGDDEVQSVDQVGSNPILVAQVVMLENANKVLESSVESLRSGQQEKLAPLLERIALLEEEKRIMEEEMHTKIHCREQTISNLEESLKQATQSRLTKKKKSSALQLSEQLLARATQATSD